MCEGVCGMICECVSYSGGIYMVHMHQVANLKTQMEAQKLESIKYLAGGILVVECSFQLLNEPSHFPFSQFPGGIFSIVTIVLSVVLGMWRLMK